MGSEAVVSTLIISLSTEDTRIFTGKTNGSFSITAESNNDCVHRHVAISTATLIELYECMPSCVLNTIRCLDICSHTFLIAHSVRKCLVLLGSALLWLPMDPTNENPHLYLIARKLDLNHIGALMYHLLAFACARDGSPS